MVLLTQACSEERVLGDDAIAAHESALMASLQSGFVLDFVQLTLTNRPNDPIESRVRLALGTAVELLRPGGCVVFDRMGTTVDARFDGCSNFLGLRDLSGDARLVYTPGAGSMRLDVDATGLRTNGYTLDVDLSAEFTRPNDVSTLAVNATTAWSRDGGRLRQTGDWVATLTIRASLVCITIPRAEFAVTVDGGFFGTTRVSDYSVCEKYCPLAPGFVESAGKDGLVRVTYNGTPRVTWDGGEASGELVLECQP